MTGKRSLLACFKNPNFIADGSLELFYCPLGVCVVSGHISFGFFR